MATEYTTNVEVKGSSEKSCADKAKVIKNFLKNISEKDFAKLAEKIKGDPNFFTKITPYLSMI